MRDIRKRLSLLQTPAWLAVQEDPPAEELAKVTAERDKWRDLYTASTIQGALTAAAGAADAVDPEQITALLRRHTRLVDEGGGYAVKVAFGGAELTPTEAVERMKSLPSYANLFRPQGAGNQPPRDPAAYRQWRKQQGLGGRR